MKQPGSVGGSSAHAISTGQILARGRVSPFAVTETTQRARRVHTHSHEQAHFSLLLSGTYRERLDGRPYDCLPGSLLMKPPGVTHSNEFPGPATCLIVEVDDPALRDPDLAKLFARPQQLGAARLGATIQEVRRELRTQEACSDLMIHALLLQLLVAAGRTSPARNPLPDIARAIDYIHSGYRSPITLAGVATAASLSVSTLTTAFHRQVGCTVGEYVRRIRLDHALMMLAGTDRPIAAVASETGFSDQSHLTRLFRRHMGQTPAEFRRASTRNGARPPLE